MHSTKSELLENLKGVEAGIELDKEDEEILDRVWAQIGEEEAAKVIRDDSGRIKARQQ